MKKTVILVAVLAGVITVNAQEKLSREEALKYAFVVSGDLQQMLKTPIPTDPDVKRPTAVRDEDYGGMVLPECKLSASAFDNAASEPVSVGQLWLYKLAPMTDGQSVSAGRLHVVHLSSSQGEADVPCCALGVRKTGDGSLELLIYGKGQDPVLRAPISKISSTQKEPVEMTAERRDDGGLITLRFLGKYEASFMVTDPDRA